MARRIQEQEEERVVSESRPAVMNMCSYLMSSSSSAASSPIASKSPGTSGASGSLGSRMNFAASSFNEGLASQVRLQDAYLGGLTTAQLFKISKKLSCSSPRIILYNSQIHVMVISEMHCCSESGIHKYSPHGHIHIQIFHRIVCWSSVDFSDHVVDVNHVRDVIRPHGEEVFHCRSFFYHFDLSEILKTRILLILAASGFPQACFF